MTADEILEELQSNRGVFPRKALLEAIEQHEVVLPRLIAILEAATSDIVGVLGGDGYFAHFYALFLSAQFRAKEAYPPILSLVKHPGDVLSKVWGDVITEDLDRILASVCAGDTQPIKELIESPDLDE